MINFTQLTLKRHQQILLENANATINPKQKVGLVGKNGCGKSSLLALIKGELSPEKGEINLPTQWRISWVNQETPALDISAIDYVIQGDREYQSLQQQLKQANLKNDGHSIAKLHGQLDDIDAWSIEARAAILLHGLGFSNEKLNHLVKSFSGGWRMRLNLAQALICRSDLLLLDEPTNHLDLEAVIWLEKWLSQYYKGTLILISHDRNFLDPIVNKIIHIEQQLLNEYSGNYSYFEQQRILKLAQQNASYQQQQQKISHMQAYIDRFRAKASKAKQAQSRINALKRMQLISPAHVDNPFNFQFKPPLALPNPLVDLQNVTAGYQSENPILKSIKLNLVPGSRIGLLGKNGVGKSTLIKLLGKEILPLSGNIIHSKGVKIGYFAQHQLDTLRASESVLWHLQHLSPQETEQNLRNYLGGFAFHGDKVKQSVKNLSGGEKARLVLALIVWQRPNLLLLDEPTNHLDLDMRQALTEALIDFEGALIVVSHDRHLLRNTVDEFYLVNNFQVNEFKGDLEDYHQWLLDSNIDFDEKSSHIVEFEKTHSQAYRKEKKRLEAELRQQLSPLRKKAEQYEKQLEKLQVQLNDVELTLTDSQLYQDEQKQRLTETLALQVELKRQIASFEEAWFDLLERIELLTQSL